MTLLLDPPAIQRFDFANVSLVRFATEQTAFAGSADQLMPKVVSPSTAQAVNRREKEEDEMSVASGAFLATLYRAAEVNESAAMRMIYSYVFGLRQKQDYGLCDRILEDIDEKRLAPFLMVAFLTITAPLKEDLRQRAGFFERARSAIAATRGPEAAIRTLVGLE